MYYFSKTVNDSFVQTIERTKMALSNEGLGVLTEIDIQATLRKK
jgi:uncharacterized protein (DUF302 family)